MPIAPIKHPAAPFSTAVMKSTLTLNTEQGKSFAGNPFENMAHCLFVIDVISRKLTENTANCKLHRKVSTAVGKRFQEMENDIKSETERLELFLKQAKVTERATYTNPTIRTVDVASPDVRRLCDLLMAFDNMIMLLDTAWLWRMIDTVEANEYRMMKKRALKKFLGSLMEHAWAAKKSVNASDDEEIKKIIAVAEADLAKVEAKNKVDEPTEKTPTAA